MRRIIYLAPGPLPFDADPALNKFHYLSSSLSGDVLVPVWGDGSDPTLISEMGGFTFHYLPGYGRARKFIPKKLATSVRRLFFYVNTGRRLAREAAGRGQPVDAVVSCGTYVTALAGLALKYLLRVPLVVEVRGHPTKPFLYEEGTALWRRRLKARLAAIVVRMALSRADGIKLLYPTQLESLGSFSRAVIRCFHDFVPLSAVPPHHTTDPRTILCMGYPWELKGVDILIRAFHAMTVNDSTVTLKVVGGCLDRAPFLSLASGDPRISFEHTVPYAKALQQIADAFVFVLPSRTEGMGRVILEAMAAGIPVIASRVDGIPTYVEHGTTGYLIEVEDVEGLKARLEELLQTPGLARSLGAAGQSRAQARYTEERFAEQFGELVTAVSPQWR